MPLTSPNLDDRTFEQLLEAAKSRAKTACPEWTDMSESDPGVALLELFAFLTETLLYRVNLLPDKAYVEFLRLMGVTLHPPHAAQVMLRFSRTKSAGGEAKGGAELKVPRFATRVKLARAPVGSDPKDLPVFITTADAVLAKDAESIDVPAMHFEAIEGELVGMGTGLGGQRFQVSRAPIIAGDRDASLEVGVETIAGEPAGGPTRKFGDQGKVFRLWTEVENYAELGTDRRVYIADRAAGTISFAPAVETFDPRADSAGGRSTTLAEVPQAGREVRVWYWRGGGRAGNVAEGTLTVMQNPIAGLDVTNPGRATGGSDAESMANALARGPQTIHSLNRAVTARDYERLAEGTGLVSRARAFARASLWVHSAQGIVQVLLVPKVGETCLPADKLLAYHLDGPRDGIQARLAERSPLGAKVMVSWVNYKIVNIKARVSVFPGEDADNVKRRIIERLNQLISPLPTALLPGGWPFQEALQVGRAYDAIYDEPGVKNVDKVRLRVTDVPDQLVKSVTADPFQPRTWHVASDGRIYRSTDDGEAWDLMRDFPGREPGYELRIVRSHRWRPGILAAITVKAQAGGRIYVSEDCGDSWRQVLATNVELRDVAWIQRDGVPTLLIAADNGLYEHSLTEGAVPQQFLVGDLEPDTGFWTVTVAADTAGRAEYVAVAAQSKKGVWISHEAGRSKTYLKYAVPSHSGDVRVLAVQNDGARRLLWAGITLFGSEADEGCYRWGGANEGWKQYSVGWKGATCYSLATSPTRVWAATHRGGVVTLNTMQADPKWNAPDFSCGLPFKDDAFIPVRSVAVEPSGAIVMAGTDRGTVKSTDLGKTFAPSSKREFDDFVPLSPTSLFCAGEHEIEID